MTSAAAAAMIALLEELAGDLRLACGASLLHDAVGEGSSRR